MGIGGSVWAWGGGGPGLREKWGQGSLLDSAPPPWPARAFPSVVGLRVL